MLVYDPVIVFRTFVTLPGGNNSRLSGKTAVVVGHERSKYCFRHS